MNSHKSSRFLPRSHQSCVTPAGCFCYGIHKPEYEVLNLREKKQCDSLGSLPNGASVNNSANFPVNNISVEKGDWLFEIPNPLPFRGTTYITRSWAEAKAIAPESIALPESPDVSMSEVIRQWHPKTADINFQEMFARLPQAVLLTLAAHSTDPDDLAAIAKMVCEISFAPDGEPTGLLYREETTGRHPIITNPPLFEIVVNNPHLPDRYKNIMVLKPGVQGGSEIVGDFNHPDSHVFEYLRRNSYIPWGHYAANMANDTIRYDIGQLSRMDIKGLRHLYYQRTYTRMTQELKLPSPVTHKEMSENELETIRGQIIAKINKGGCKSLQFSSTLWGWNYGFSSAANGYRLHASHQMIHQQFAMLPHEVTAYYSIKDQQDKTSDLMPSYGCGDLVADFIRGYKETTGNNFFDDYLKAIRQNQRMDNRSDLPGSLIIFEDKNVILFVPKAQTSQWELQLMTINKIGNILETDTQTRNSLDNAMLLAMQILTGLGAKMITTIEMPKRFSATDGSQRLLYSFLPKLPESPGAFSEAQLRWINGHYPEDFARACRTKIVNIRHGFSCKQRREKKTHTNA